MAPTFVGLNKTIPRQHNILCNIHILRALHCNAPTVELDKHILIKIKINNKIFMMLFHDYKRRSIRKKHFNYSQSAYYFITICTQNREHLFGEIINGNMILNKYGQIIKNYWSEIPHHFKQIKLDEFIVMPNHIHGIIQCELWDSFVGALHCNALKQEINTNHYFSTITPKKNSLSSIMRSFKSICTREIRKIKGPYIVWQKNFYDIIIHNKTQLKTIKHYIKINPKIWNRDRNNTPP